MCLNWLEFLDKWPINWQLALLYHIIIPQSSDVHYSLLVCVFIQHLQRRFFKKYMETKGFFQLEIIINVLVISFRSMLWVYGQ